MSKKERRKQERIKAAKARAEAARKALEALPETVTCRICKGNVKFAISDAHFHPDNIGKEGGCNEDGRGLKLSEYQEKFPDAPVKAPRIRELERRQAENAAIMGRLKKAAKPVKHKAGIPSKGKPSLEVIDKFLQQWVPEVREDLITMGLHLQAALEILHEKAIILKTDLLAKEKELVEEARRRKLDADKKNGRPVQVVDGHAESPVAKPQTPNVEDSQASTTEPVVEPEPVQEASNA